MGCISSKTNEGFNINNQDPRIEDIEINTQDLLHNRRKILDKTNIPSNKLMTFISSTFTDTHSERNIFMKEILPKLQKMSREHGIDVTFSDMRWGILDENTLHHETWVSCKRELERCRRESGGLFFLSLVSNILC
jgi:iron-sulfur cluster repair protein YtfE (RIC family)